MVYIRNERQSDPKTARMVVEGLPQPRQGSGVLPWRNSAEWHSNYELDQSGRAWLSAMIPILNGADETGVFADPQDAEALFNGEQALALLRSWWEKKSPVRLSARTVEPVSAEGRGVGCFFSGGVDSFYSTLAHFEEITHLVFVTSGFDIWPVNRELTAKTLDAVSAVAKAYDKPLITVETNVRALSGRFARWGHHYHGAALATVGQLLSPHLRKVIIPSSYQRSELNRWGSHPDLDRLYSSSYLEVFHDTVEPSRTDKVASIAQDDVAMGHLKVCWRNPNNEYNCGRCEKCLRTMIALYAFDGLEKCQTFEDKIDMEMLEQIDVRFGHLHYAKKNVELLEATRGVQDDVYKTLKRRVDEELLRISKTK